MGFPDDRSGKSKDSKVKTNKYGDIISDTDAWSFDDAFSDSSLNKSKNIDPYDAGKDNIAVNNVYGSEESSKTDILDHKDENRREDVLQKSFLNSSYSKKLFVCTNVGVVSLIIGGIFGSAVGAAQGAIGGFRYQLHHQPEMFRQFVAQSSMASAANFGIWLGTYSSARCTAVAIRNHDDSLNALFSGGVAGAVSSLRTRNPRAIMWAGAVSGFTMFVFDLLSGRH